ncbi:hypothetical protein GCM10010430_53610 [Kitasatospora cystarginea]|uniref:Uncharacterized protein n=1 Tax=Kitasatospora cystarginea TaxID=58350 RepID=A0ABP5RM11_9ACTN
MGVGVSGSVDSGTDGTDTTRCPDEPQPANVTTAHTSTPARHHPRALRVVRCAIVPPLRPLTRRA